MSIIRKRMSIIQKGQLKIEEIQINMELENLKKQRWLHVILN